MKNRKNRLGGSTSGLTLIEIILVLALLGLVATYIGNKVYKTFGKGKRKIAQIYLNDLKGSLDQYKIDCNSYPRNLDALVQNPGNCPAYDPDGYQAGKKTLQNDPFGCKPFYSYDGTTMVLKSLGDGCKEGGDGDQADIEFQE